MNGEERSRSAKRSISKLQCVLVVIIAATTIPVISNAEESQPVADGATTGYELSLHGVVNSELGNSVRLHGVAYEVLGLSTLRPTKGLGVDAVISIPRQEGEGREEVARTEVTTSTGGRFQIAIQLPRRVLPSPRLELHVHRRGQPGRTFFYGVHARLPQKIDLLVDRRRYEPGETVRAFVRLAEVVGRSPTKGAGIQLTLFDEQGHPVAKRTQNTSAAGVAAFEMALPESAAEGSWRVHAETTSGGLSSPVERSFTVLQRTVERLQATLELDQDLLRPGGPLTGRVEVLTPAGSPVLNARVELSRDDSELLILTTDRNGTAHFETQAPAFLSGDMATQTLEARVVHAAYGTIRASANYTVARVRWLVEATPGAGGIVPEVESALYLGVHNPRGRPIAAGTKVRVRGVGIPGGHNEVTTDAHGLAVVTVVLPLGASSQRRSGACSGTVATTFEVEVLTQPPVVTRLCVPVSDEALLVPRAERALFAPGDDIEVRIQRRPAVAGRPVLVEALDSHRAIAWALISERQSVATLSLPSNVQGVIELRARPVWSESRSRPLDQPGATALGRGAATAVLIRPRDAFTLQVRPSRELWRIREEAQVQLTASQAPQQAWAALLVRDEAAHGGEIPWDLHWIQGELQEAMTEENNEENDRFLRVALAALCSRDDAQAEPPPLVTPPWASSRHTGAYPAHLALQRGVVRDPVARREELLRRGLAPVMRALENAVEGLGSNVQARNGIVRHSGNRVSFHPSVVANLIRARQLSQSQAQTLGGELLTVAMITSADSSFTFDTVARRVARARLVRVLQGLLQLANPDDPNAARAIASEPPERWLSRLVQLAMVDSEALVDPWGRPFVFRRASGGRQPVVIASERAIDFELVSSGPDGVLGNADDVRDPFERVVNRGTPYAVSSGEDILMEQLSRIAPGNQVLQNMVLAYRRMGLAAQEEQRRGPVEATGSEDAAPASELEVPLEEEAALDQMLDGALGGEDRRARRAGPMRRDQAGEGRSETFAAQGIAPGMPPPPPMSTPTPTPSAGLASAMGAIVRQDFPATLFFLAETPFDGQGRAEVQIPLADALTTYRVEAIAWTASGWTTSASGRIQVDQEAMVDAPVPQYATVGDHLRIPVRIANRTKAALPVRIEIDAEGDLQLQALEQVSLDIPPGEARESIIDVRPSAAGDGALLVRALRADDGRSLDAVRRPMGVLSDMRLARELREELLVAGREIIVEVPVEASARGPGELRLAVGADLFGNPAVWAAAAGDSSALWAGWSLALAERSFPEEQMEQLMHMVPEAGTEWQRSTQDIALLLAILWRDGRLSDEVAATGLRMISQDFPAEGEELDPEMIDPADDNVLWLLIALAPVLRNLEARPELRSDLERIAAQLRRQVSSGAAAATDAPVIWARAAAALALINPGLENTRALELERRARRSVISVGDESWLEANDADGTVLSRLEPTALLALAHLSLFSDRGQALSLLRSLIHVIRGVDSWPYRSRALASAAAALLTSGNTDLDQITVTLDGRPLEIRREEGVLSAGLDGIGEPGNHVINVSLRTGEVALAWIDFRYGLPWSVHPRRVAPVDLEWTGVAGARDGRAGLGLIVRNRGARILTRPVVEIEIPAGSELDEATRLAFAELLSAPAAVEGRTLRLRLRPLAPGGYVVIPVPLRWALSGTIIGLGTTVWDDTGPVALSTRPISVLPSTGVEIADVGDVPEGPEAEASPPPIEPRPFPLPYLEPLAAEVL